ncbi:MAG: transglycosylase SLT domain-containing protein [Bacteroidota bacterium]|nr:transglycosylase SLT domain-containing protein [Bacteroidota bacterium]
MKYFLLSFLLITSIFSSFSQNSATRGPSEKPYTTISQYSDILDSMVAQWYFKKHDDQIIDINSEVSEKEAELLSDSVVIARLKSVPSVFPLKYNDKVASWIKLYIKRNNRSPYLIGMTDYYFPMFEEILDRYNMPLELKYIPIIESALNPEARSRMGAVGLWQFMYSTGKMYGLQVNSYVDERSDPVKSTHAAALFMKDLYELYGDWTLVLAAYNCGPGNVNKAIRRSGKRSFWDIYPYLPRETRGYVPAYIAAAYMMNFYEDHKIVPKKPKINTFTDTIGVSKKLHLRQVSEVLNIPFDELKAMNPQFRRDILPGDKVYYLRLPFNSTGQFIKKEEEIYAYKDSVFFNNKIVVTPPSYNYRTRAKAYTPTSVKGRTKLTYTIKAGDTYGFIADWYGVNVSDLRHWNGIRSNRLQIGQKIAVWVPKNKASKYKGINNMSSAQRKSKIKTTVKTSSGNTPKPKNKNYVYHKVKAGESLWTIAKKYPGVSDKDIKQINHFSRRDVQTLKLGQYIKIKSK